MFILMGISINIYRGIKTGGNINDKKRENIWFFQKN